MISLNESIRPARIHFNVSSSAVPRTALCKYKIVSVKDTFESIMWRCDGKLQLWSLINTYVSYHRGVPWTEVCYKAVDLV